MFTKKRIILLIVIALLFVILPVLAAILNVSEVAKAEQMQVLTLWQIDGFEGGKGSRAQYLSGKAKKLFKDGNKYLNAITLTATAASENLERGELPDMISCSPTFNAHLNFINHTDFVYKTWCYGSYCVLTLAENADFSDINAQNTVVNEGKDNLTDVLTTLCGVGGATKEASTNAYLQLLNGKYKYLLGTQRDVFRLKTRGVAFSIKPITEFNDLYQNVSILTKDKKRYETCKLFVEYITENDSDVNKIGLFSPNCVKYDDEQNILQYVKYERVLSSPCGYEFLMSLKSAAESGDANKIKNLLK